MNSTFDKIMNLAEEAGLSDTAAKFSGVRGEIYERRNKQYAILGDLNSGKSSLLNILAGEKVAPVSIIGGGHDAILTVGGQSGDYSWVEMATESFMDGSLPITENPLWQIDAAIYVIAAVAPLNTTDIATIQSCIGHGIPCSLALSKFDLIPEEERDGLLQTVKSQLYSLFGSDEIVVIDATDEAKTRDAVTRALESAEDSRNTREYLLTVAFAKAVKEKINRKYTECKARFDESAKRRDADRSNLEKLNWDQIELDLTERKMRLLKEINDKFYSLYNDCSAKILKNAEAASNAEAWWKNQLEPQMRAENAAIADRINETICERLTADRDWLAREVRDKFNLSMNPTDADGKYKVSDVRPRQLDPGFGKPGNGRIAAISGLTISALALCGTFVLPATIPFLLSTSMRVVATAAVAGTGFWTYYATQTDNSAKKKILQQEIFKYVSECRDTNLKKVRSDISYIYENMLISIMDLQLVRKAEKSGPAENPLSDELIKISSANKKCDEILNSLVLSAED